MIASSRIRPGTLIYTKPTLKETARQKIYYATENYLDFLSSNIKPIQIISNDGLETMIQANWNCLNEIAKFNSKVFSGRLYEMAGIHSYFSFTFLPFNKRSHAIGIATGKIIPLKLPKMQLSYLVETIVIDQSIGFLRKIGRRLWVLLDENVAIFDCNNNFKSRKLHEK